jgi:hypothetical protein
MKPILVVGTGIAGSIVARLLHKRGHDIITIDDADPMSASAASSNLFIAGWLNKFPKDVRQRGLEVINELFAEHIERPFSGGIASAVAVRHIPQRHLLVRPDLQERCDFRDKDSCGNERAYSHIIWCCGYRAFDFLPHIIKSQAQIVVGHACFFRGQLGPRQSRLAIISPYKHEKLYQFDEDIIYYADSVTLRLDSYEKRKDEIKQRTLTRARKHVGYDAELLEWRTGYRPVLTPHPYGLLHRVNERNFVLTGGGKNGIVAYAYQASMLLEQLS